MQLETLVHLQHLLLHLLFHILLRFLFQLVKLHLLTNYFHYILQLLLLLLVEMVAFRKADTNFSALASCFLDARKRFSLLLLLLRLCVSRSLSLLRLPLCLSEGLKPG